jgi:hypothetical protein
MNVRRYSKASAFISTLVPETRMFSPRWVSVRCTTRVFKALYSALLQLPAAYMVACPLLLYVVIHFVRFSNSAHTFVIICIIISMLISTIRPQGLALRLKPQALSQFIAQHRSASTLTDQEPYWQKIKPWRDVPAEEFKSYRWQVSLDCINECQGAIG